MSFNGTPVIQKISRDVLRITGLSLSANTSGLIGLAEASGSPIPDFLLPAAFSPEVFHFDDLVVPLVAGVKV